MIVQWNSETGQLNQAFQLSQSDIVHSKFEKNILYVVTTDGMIHVLMFLSYT
jgi:hypothetical protein